MTSYSVVLQNSAALLNSSSFCFSLFRQPWLAVDIRPLARSHLSEKSFGLTDVTGDFWLVWDFRGGGGCNAGPGILIIGLSPDLINTGSGIPVDNLQWR